MVLERDQAKLDHEQAILEQDKAILDRDLLMAERVQEQRPQKSVANCNKKVRIRAATKEAASGREW